jgi:hypothetical protein
LAAGRERTTRENAWGGAVAALIGLALIPVIGFIPALGVIALLSLAKGVLQRHSQKPRETKQEEDSDFSYVEYWCSVGMVAGLAFAIVGSLFLRMTAVYFGGGLILLSAVIALDERGRQKRERSQA